MVVGHEKSKQELNLKFLPCWLPIRDPEGAIKADEGEKLSTFLSRCESCEL